MSQMMLSCNALILLNAQNIFNTHPRCCIAINQRCVLYSCNVSIRLMLANAEQQFNVRFMVSMSVILEEVRVRKQMCDSVFID